VTTPHDPVVSSGLIADLSAATRRHGFAVIVAAYFAARDWLVLGKNLERIAGAVEAQGAALVKLAEQEKAHANAIASLVPRVRLPVMPALDEGSP
jgi:hypothetical protein